MSYGILTSLTLICSTLVIGAASEGGKSEYAMDILILTVLVHLGLFFTSWAWFLFLLIPMYALYKGGRQLRNYIFSPEEKTTVIESKRQTKHRLKASR